MRQENRKRKTKWGRGCPGPALGGKTLWGMERLSRQRHAHLEGFTYQVSRAPVAQQLSTLNNHPHFTVFSRSRRGGWGRSRPAHFIHEELLSQRGEVTHWILCLRQGTSDSPLESINTSWHFMTALHTSAQTALTTRSAGEHQHHLRFPKEKKWYEIFWFGFVEKFILEKRKKP